MCASETQREMKASSCEERLKKVCVLPVLVCCVDLYVVDILKLLVQLLCSVETRLNGSLNFEDRRSLESIRSIIARYVCPSSRVLGVGCFGVRLLMSFDLEFRSSPFSSSQFSLTRVCTVQAMCATWPRCRSKLPRATGVIWRRRTSWRRSRLWCNTCCDAWRRNCACC